MSFLACGRSFDGLAACGANDTVFVNSRVAKKGGAVALSTGTLPSSLVEFHRCTVNGSSTGDAIKDDPQGEGGAFAVGGGGHVSAVGLRSREQLLREEGKFIF